MTALSHLSDPPAAGLITLIMIITAVAVDRAGGS